MPTLAEPRFLFVSPKWEKNGELATTNGRRIAVLLVFKAKNIKARNTIVCAQRYHRVP